MAKKKAKKKATKKKAKRASKSRDVLVVASKVKNYIRSQGMMCSSDAVQAMSENIYGCLDRAIERAQANRRSTIKPQDL